MQRKSRMGRPPLPADEKRSQRIMLNLTPGEYEALKRAAGKQSPPTYAREVLVRHLARKKR